MTRIWTKSRLDALGGMKYWKCQCKQSAWWPLYFFAWTGKLIALCWSSKERIDNRIVLFGQFTILLESLLITAVGFINLCWNKIVLSVWFRSSSQYIQLLSISSHFNYDLLSQKQNESMPALKSLLFVWQNLT